MPKKIYIYCEKKQDEISDLNKNVNLNFSLCVFFISL